ncbi:hypothetical protein Dimus_028028 [Dionaea muscipula]
MLLMLNHKNNPVMIECYIVDLVITTVRMYFSPGHNEIHPLLHFLLYLVSLRGTFLFLFTHVHLFCLDLELEEIRQFLYLIDVLKLYPSLTSEDASDLLSLNGIYL